MRLYQAELTPRELTVAYRRMGTLIGRALAEPRKPPPSGEYCAKVAPLLCRMALPAMPARAPCPAETRRGRRRAALPATVGAPAKPKLGPAPEHSPPPPPHPIPPAPPADSSRDACAQLFGIGQALLPDMDVQGLATAIWCCSRFHHVPTQARLRVRRA